MCTSAVVIYTLAGLFGFYMSVEDKLWQRLLTIPFWLVLFIYSVLVDAADWLKTKGYQYPENGDEE